MIPTILVVDDEFTIRDLLQGYLRKAGYEVITAVDGESALEIFAEKSPALVVLDVMLPGELDGWEVCRHLRETSNTPILMLTSLVGDSNQVTGLELGADDYVTKPFSPRQVVARVKALLRRAGYSGQPLQRGPIQLDPVARTVAVAGRPVSLTGHEFALLEMLLRNPGRAFSRAELLDRCWEPGFDGVDRVVDVHMAAVRRKLGSHKNMISTVRGLGYRFDEQ
jgi:two-component system alkaline phosphatase synthesis response regulator PhoP